MIQFCAASVHVSHSSPSAAKFSPPTPALTCAGSCLPCCAAHAVIEALDVRIVNTNQWLAELIASVQACIAM